MKDISLFLAQLNKELQRAEDFDIDARAMLNDFRKDIGEIEESGAAINQEAMQDRIKELEAGFAAKHPSLERIAREFADALAKMGI
jgi:hypothetical protein